MAEDQIVIVRGPLAASAGSGVIYQVTLANGHTVTRPEAWSGNGAPAPAIVPAEPPAQEATEEERADRL